MILYKQISKLTTMFRDETEVNIYEWVFAVKEIGNTEKSSIIYDRELKMYFENPTGATYIYEVEFRNVNLNLCQRLSKSENFNRKLFYRYDFIQPRINYNGQVISILNKTELKQTWLKLRSRIITDHKGDIVERYLDKTDMEFTTDNTLYPAINQYLYFGLLFPNLPKSHNNSWVGKRLIEFSPYEREQFEEITTIESMNDKEVSYCIKGNILSNSKAIIKNFSGYAIKSVNENFAKNIELSASFTKDNYQNTWEFKFYKI